MAGLADYRIDIEHVSTGKRADSITTRAASEAEARRKAEDEIRHSPTPNDLRVATVTCLASVPLAGEGTMNASAEVVRLYDTDIVAWAEQQALALRCRAANEIDWDNVAEEIEDLAARQKREVGRRLRIICEHLLKWRHWIRTRASTRPLNDWRSHAGRAAPAIDGPPWGEPIAAQDRPRRIAAAVCECAPGRGAEDR